MTRVGLVLGAGGPVGHAFHAGVLHAIEKVTGWDARTSEIIIGTSAGAQVAALLRAGLSTADLLARIMDRPLTPRGASIARYYIRPPHNRPHPDHPMRLVPSAPRYVCRAVREPRRFHIGLFAASMFPEGRVSLDAQAEGFRQLFTDGWPREELWIPAVCLDTGERVVFGRPDAPVTDVGSAVTASGAVPGLCVPVRVGSHRYVDGCCLSSIHLDIVTNSGLDAVVVSSPLSRFRWLRGLVRREARHARAAGVAVLLIEPERQTIVAMGWNPFDDRKLAAVARSASARAIALLEDSDQAEMRHWLEVEGERGRREEWGKGGMGE